MQNRYFEDCFVQYFLNLLGEKKRIKKVLTREGGSDIINKLSRSGGRGPWKLNNKTSTVEEKLSCKRKTPKILLKKIKRLLQVREQRNRKVRGTNTDREGPRGLTIQEIREFDPGSGWTLAACITHSSRTGYTRSLLFVYLVADGWVTREQPAW